MAKVALSDHANKDFEDLDGSAKRLVALGLIKLESSPGTRGMALSGNLAGWRKLIVGRRAIRIIYQYEASTDTVWVVAIGPRRNEEVYRTAVRRLPPVN
jgi:mRNA interferase RelE/StbE